MLVYIFNDNTSYPPTYRIYRSIRTTKCAVISKWYLLWFLYPE